MIDIGYKDELEWIAPAKCILCGGVHGHADGCRLNLHPPRSLVVQAPMGPNFDGWGNIGKRIVSYAIVGTWRLNDFLEKAFEDSENVYVLSERAQLYLTGKIKESELKLSPVQAARAKAPGEHIPDEILDAPIEGLLFTRGGTCTLCGTKMEVYGQVSHAKSHINKGHPVTIEEINKKKVCKVAPGAVIEPPVERPPVEQGDFVGPELFSTTGVCRLCPPGTTVHLFGRISHAKSHIKKGDPVELRTIQKKTVPVIAGEIMPEPPVREAEPYNPARANGQYQKAAPTPVDPSTLTPEAAHAREEGIAALLKIQEVAGLEGDREEAAINWDKMGPVSRMQTLRTAKSLEG